MMFDWLSPGLYAVEAMGGYEDVWINPADEEEIVPWLRLHGVKVSTVNRELKNGELVLHVSNKRRAERLIERYRTFKSRGMGWR